MKTFLIIALLVMGAIGFAVYGYTTGRATSHVVTLQAAPGSKLVQMFDGLGEHPKVVRNLLSGDTCDYVSGPLAINQRGVKMKFYTLTCAGRTGFVNAKFVH